MQQQIKIWSLMASMAMLGFVANGQMPGYNSHQKGHAYFFWGWNVSRYSNSDIALAGADYDFTIYNVVAHDRPTYPIALDPYVKPGKMSIPQTNFKLGYFIKDGLAINAGLDHMKYVMDQNQVVHMKGRITRAGKFEGVYDGPQKMEAELLTFEHTDGLNFINAEIEKYLSISSPTARVCKVSLLAGAGAGVLLPKTNVKLLDYERNDQFHLSGWGIHAKAGLEVLFFRHLMLRTEGKLGYINMPDITLHKQGIPGKGKQNFFFAEAIAAVGYTVLLAPSKKDIKVDL